MLEIAKTGTYRLLVKYTNNENIKVQPRVVLEFHNTSGAGDLFTFSPSLSEECADCIETINPDLDYLSLTKGQWTINITTTQPYDQLKLVTEQPIRFNTSTVFLILHYYSTIFKNSDTIFMRVTIYFA